MKCKYLLEVHLQSYIYFPDRPLSCICSNAESELFRFKASKRDIKTRLHRIDFYTPTKGRTHYFLPVLMASRSARVARANAEIEADLPGDYSDEVEEFEEEVGDDLDVSGRLVQPVSYNRNLLELYRTP